MLTRHAFDLGALSPRGQLFLLPQHARRAVLDGLQLGEQDRRLPLVDVVWGNLLHISDHVVTRRYGFLERFLQTPSYHRVHHGRNVRYVDTNYNSITLLWDWLLGTLQPLDDSDPVAYGITREVDTRSFRDVHFGDFRALWRDVRAAPNGVAVLLTLLKPPGWSATGESNTAAARWYSSPTWERPTPTSPDGSGRRTW